MTFFKDRKINYKFLLGSLLVLAFISTNIVVSSLGPSEKFTDDLSYRSSLGVCPARPAGNMALQVMKTFEQSGSLRDVKKKMVQEKWQEKYFVSDYKINYDPYTKVLNLNFDCPKPLMKVQIYKANGIDSYEAVLVDNGELYDPTYEVLLRSENKLSGELPYLALPVGEMENKTQLEITQLVKGLREELRKKLSEIILNDQKELTVILSINGYPSSVFLGLDEWSEKITKLDKIVNFLETQEKIPAVINLTNSKKVVVKFRE